MNSNPQQSGFANPGYQKPASYGGYQSQSSYPQGPSVNINMGPQAGPDGSAGGGGAWTAEPIGLFAEKAIRQAFISKVYSILTVQLIFTSILIGAFVLNNDTKMYFARAQGWMFLGFAIFFVSYLVLICVESARRTAPLNFVLLSVLTLGYGLVAAITSCRYNTTAVMYAFVATGLSCALIAAFAKSTKFDMTNCGTTLCLLGLGHMLIGTIMVLILVPMGYAKLIMGGRKCELSPEEYILGAVILYTDIIQMFIFMLEIFGRMGDD